MKTTMISLSREISPLQLDWRNHPSINSWTRQNGILSDAEHERWLEKIKTDPTILMFGIMDRSSGITLDVGTCGLTSISHIHGTAEFSLLIDPDEQGKGYGKAALEALLRYGFKNLRLNCIWGETFEGNPAVKMFKKIGFKFEGTNRSRYFKNGYYINSASYSIVRDEAERRTWWNS